MGLNKPGVEDVMTGFDFLQRGLYTKADRPAHPRPSGGNIAARTCPAACRSCRAAASSYRLLTLGSMKDATCPAVPHRAFCIKVDHILRVSGEAAKLNA